MSDELGNELRIGAVVGGMTVHQAQGISSARVLQHH